MKNKIIEYENLHNVNKSFSKEFQFKFKDVLESGWFILGSQVDEFEKEFASYNNIKYCCGVASGLDALILALKALQLNPGSEVIVPSNTYIATILSIIRNGLTPILVEPDIKTYNIDPARIEEKITLKTSAIIVVHLYGKVCDMDPITNICKHYSLKLVEDCAQAHGAKYKGKFAGTFGDFGAFSFYPTKNLGALGDGGALITNNEFLDRKIRMLRNYGSNKKYYNEIVGYNSRLDEIQAAFLNVKLKYLNEINAHKRELAKLYQQELKNEFIKPELDDNYYDVYHIFNIRHTKRNIIKEYLLENNIKTEIHYPVPPNKQLAMKGVIDHYSCPVSDEIHDTTLSLPISFSHTTDDIMRVIDVINKFR